MSSYQGLPEFACAFIRAEGVHTHWRYALLAHRLCGGIRVCAYLSATSPGEKNTPLL